MRTYHESYGELDRSTLATIRKYNVSPSDYDGLTGVFGNDEQAIRNAIEEYSPRGYYSEYLMMADRVN